MFFPFLPVACPYVDYVVYTNGCVGHVQSLDENSSNDLEISKDLYSWAPETTLNLRGSFTRNKSSSFLTYVYDF
jgi:hypothetical protein